MSYALIAIDPGVKALGWAAFDAKGALLLAGASIIRGRLKDLNSAVAAHLLAVPRADRAAVERMVYRQEDDKSWANDLLDVNWVGASVGGGCSSSPVISFTAQEWKGSVPKVQHHKRIRRELEPLEAKMLDSVLASGIPGSNHKEVLDAVGIGLLYVGRTDKAGRKRR